MCVVLAVGRADGSVALVSVEEGRTLHTHTLTTHHITSLHWMTQDEARQANTVLFFLKVKVRLLCVIMKQALEEAFIIKNLDYCLRDCDAFVVSITNSSLYMLMCVIINITAFLMAVGSTEVVPPHSSLPSLHWTEGKS